MTHSNRKKGDQLLFDSIFPIVYSFQCLTEVNLKWRKTEEAQNREKKFS